MAYCTSCGKKIDDNAIICPYCGCQTENSENWGTTPVPPANSSANTLGIVSIICGALGLFWALLLALFGYLFGGAGLALALVGRSKDHYSRKCKTGLYLSIGALALSVLSSVIGILIMM